MSHPDGICPWCSQPMSEHAYDCPYRHAERRQRRTRALDHVAHPERLPRTVPQDPQAVEDERAVQDAFAHVAMMQRLQRKEYAPPPD